MRNRPARVALLLLGGVLALGLATLAWAIGPGSSEAQQGSMHNCPQAGKAAIAVWDGDDGTDIAEALATCGGVAFAYYLDPASNNWRGYFEGRPEVSKLLTLDDKQGIIVRGSPAATPASLAVPGATYTGTTSQDLLLQFEVSADGLTITRVRYKFSGTRPGGQSCDGFTITTVNVPIVDNSFSIVDPLFDMSGDFQTQWQATGDLTVHEPYADSVPPCDAGPLTWTATVPSATPVPSPTPPSGPGQLMTCPQPNRWAISVWTGPDDVDTETALATCPDTPVVAAYWLDPDGQQWLRYFQGRAEISDLQSLDNLQGILALGGTAVPGS